MKRIKNYAMALAALAIATTVTLLSFSKGESDQNQWHLFNEGDPLVGSSYYTIPTPAPTGCESGTRVCAILSTEVDANGEILISPALRNEISQALTLGTSTANVKVRN